MKKFLLVLSLVICFILIASNYSFAEEKGTSAEKAPKETGSVVSKTVHEAQEEGLKGTELAEKAHQAIQERKGTHETKKEKKMERKKIRKLEKKSSGTKVQVKGKGKK